MNDLDHSNSAAPSPPLNLLELKYYSCKCLTNFAWRMIAPITVADGELSKLSRCFSIIFS